MDVLTAHEMLARRDPINGRGVWPHDCTFDSPEGPVDCWPAVVTAAAIVSGGLDDANTKAELDAAIEHAKTLHAIGVVTDDDLSNATQDVLRQLLEWGDAQESSLAHLNN